jgi:hypothetical protein
MTIRKGTCRKIKVIPTHPVRQPVGGSAVPHLRQWYQFNLVPFATFLFYHVKCISPCFVELASGVLKIRFTPNPSIPRPVFQGLFRKWYFLP